ncbi:helix-turn-helix domain-containing protein [Microbaculum marinum]|uniref:Helix-turn-helix domain-containing protein n=1 Tax=Microbaculum marinum TaxID=1764581 RepID=A0AAW9RQT8_9HYPH
MATVRMRRDPNRRVQLSPETKARLDAMTPEEIEANALSDPDNPPSTEEELERGVLGRRVRLARQALGLTQEQFAERFRIPIGTLRDWEQGRRKPEAPALAYLAVIEQETDAVDRALATLS